MEWCIKNNSCEMVSCQPSQINVQNADVGMTQDEMEDKMFNESDQSTSEKYIDPCNFYHAFEVDHTKVPPCTVKAFVLRGYPIPNMPRMYYFKTLWTPNNETFNVWTHLAPGLYFVWMLYKYSQAIDLFEEWPILVTIIAALFVTFFSAIAHMFHSRSELDHCCWLLFDFFGIIAYAYGSTVSHFFACTEVDFYSRIGYWNLAMLTFNCCVVFYLLCITKIPKSASATSLANVIRISGLAYGYIYGIMPILYRYSLSDTNSASMQYHILSMVFMAISPCLYVSNKPQYYMPGKFDIIGHNHQMFHVSTALMMYFDVLAVYDDVTMIGGHWMKLKQQPDHPTLLQVGIFAVILILWCASVGLYVGRTIHKTSTLCNKRNRSTSTMDEITSDENIKAD